MRSIWRVLKARHSRRHDGQCSAATPFTVATKGRQRLDLGTFEPQDPTRQWDFHYRYQWVYGCPGGVPDNTVYQLPYDPATHHKLIQGVHGSFSHQAGSGNDYASDWAMPEGTVVLAARGGVIMGLRTDSTAHGVGERFKNSANYVIVRHIDGTYGEYLHLRPNAAMVRLGETVQAGQPIAHSGNSGYTSRPHLHFGVFRIREDILHVDGENVTTFSYIDDNVTSMSSIFRGWICVGNLLPKHACFSCKTGCAIVVGD